MRSEGSPFEFNNLISSQFPLYALQAILSDLITAQFNQHRAVYQLSEISPTESLMILQQMILTDLQVNNQELISWSWLYYRYVRVDLDLSVEVLSGKTIK